MLDASVEGRAKRNRKGGKIFGAKCFLDRFFRSVVWRIIVSQFSAFKRYVKSVDKLLREFADLRVNLMRR